MIRPATSTSTMSPRWTLSTMPLRIWRTSTGGGDSRALRRGAGRDGPTADVGRRCGHGVDLSAGGCRALEREDTRRGDR